MGRVGVVAVGAALAACTPYSSGWSYQCSGNSECGTEGKCIAGYCSFIDAQCASGYRFGELSGPQANQCVQSDAGTPDALDASVECSSAYLVCDGFETATLDSRWTSEGALTRDTSIVHRGSASLHLHIDAIGAGASASARIWEQVTLSSATTTVWARAWVRVSALPEPTNSAELFDAEQNGGTGDYAFLQSSSLSLYSGFDSSFMGGAGPVPTDTWFCVIWNIVRSTTATGSLALSGDTFAALGLTNTVTDATSPIANLRFGMYWTGTNVHADQPAVDMWLDDIITSTSSISCAD